ncbi:hypothetical protein WDU94_014531 [Cyamophila willieti]
MLFKKPAPKKSIVKRFLGVAVAGELAFAGASFFFWNKLNSDPDSRLYAYKNFKYFLEGYYMIGEKICGNTEQRDSDYRMWKAQNKI